MEQRTQLRRVFPKTVCVLDPKGETICGMIAKSQHKPYCLVRTGRVICLKAISQPPPKAYVLEVVKCGAYRLIDGQDQISIMLNKDCVEMTSERWEEWQYEMVSIKPMVVSLQLEYGVVDAELKYGKGFGSVEPYKKNELERGEVPTLPGVQQSAVGLRELRTKLKKEREEKVQGRSVELPTMKKVNVQAEQGFEWSAVREKVVEMEEEIKDWAEHGSSEEEINDKQQTDDEEVVKDDDDEATEEGLVKVDSFITGDYVNYVSGMSKKKDERLSGLSLSFPKIEGEFEKVLCIKKTEQTGFPVFEVDQATKTFRFRMIGKCDRVFVVKRSMSMVYLPAGGPL
ncbi:inclusion body protein [Wallal virus]|uniref:Non-structural protein NS2 n=1 Tax=Wallal virus TaxID=40061 RepID=U3RAB0_9REOV|nr:inclusion body protein [Wallal virus]AGX00994.1 inclusion body protein [Wallal virus]